MIGCETLTALGIKYKADKAYHHNFTDFYEKKLQHFKTEKINLLEVGVYYGNSLKMWEEYFCNGTIYGADKYHTFSSNRVISTIFDQSIEEKYAELFPGVEFDVIVDDASHYMRDQQLCFVKLFNRLRPGGVYLLEDLHTSLDTHLIYQPLRKEGKQSTLSLLEKIEKKENDYKNFYIDESYILNILKDVKSVEIFYNKRTDSVTSAIIKNAN